LTVSLYLSPVVFIGSRGQAKIADFGLARELQSADALWDRDWGGTVFYMAPEVRASMAAKEHSARLPHGLNADVWSMGVLIREIAESLAVTADAAPLVEYALVESRTARPSSTELIMKLRGLSDSTAGVVDQVLADEAGAASGQRAHTADGLDDSAVLDSLLPAVAIVNPSLITGDEEQKPVAKAKEPAGRASSYLDGGFVSAMVRDRRSITTTSTREHRPHRPARPSPPQKPSGTTES
jgi:serine/threonine protein kinase